MGQSKYGSNFLLLSGKNNFAGAKLLNTANNTKLALIQTQEH